MVRVSLLVLFVLSPGLSTALPVLHLDDTRDVVLSNWGVTQSFYLPQTKTYLHGEAEYIAALSIWPQIDDVFTRVTASNAYEIHIEYYEDPGPSRLHPTKRIGRAEFYVDIPKPMDTVFADMPEAAEVCRSRCILYVVNGVEQPLQIIAVPENPTPEPQQSGVPWGNGAENKAEYLWYPGLRATVDQSEPKENTTPASERHRVIATVILEPISMEYERSRSNKVRELGVWSPARSTSIRM